jgi:hypothetical protein
MGRMETAPILRRPLDLAANGKECSMIADLPRNSTALASQAEEAGVDALILNIDGEEGSRASQFGSYDLHDTYINDVISTVSVPCGILIGGAKVLTEEYWERIMSSQFTFVEMFAHQMPLFVLGDDRVKKVAAIATGYILEQVKQISQMEGVAAIDVATVPNQARGSPFTVLDCATLGVVGALSSRPMLLRTQKRMTPSDVSRVLALGARGFVIDPCILSGTEEGYRDDLLAVRRLTQRGLAASQPAGLAAFPSSAAV